MTMRDETGRLTVSLTRERLEEWAGRPLSDREVALLDECLPKSSMPEVVGTVVDSFVENFPDLFTDVLRQRLGPDAELPNAIRWTGWQLAKLTSQIEPLEYARDETQQWYGLDEQGSRYRWAVSHLMDALDSEETLLAHEQVVLYLDQGRLTRGS